jgi:hypothetical protein
VARRKSSFVAIAGFYFGTEAATKCSSSQAAA